MTARTDAPVNRPDPPSREAAMAVSVPAASGEAARRTGLAATAAESAGGADAGVGLNPRIGVGSGVAEVMAAFRAIGLEAMTRPWLGVEPSTEFIAQVSQAWLRRSELEPKRGDRRFTDPAWRNNPVLLSPEIVVVEHGLCGCRGELADAGTELAAGGGYPPCLSVLS